MNLREFLTNLATVSGTKDDEKVKSLLEMEGLDVDVDDSINKLTSNLLTMDAAKNNKDLQDHFYQKIESKVYGVVDEVTDTFASKYEVDKTIFNEGDSSMRKLKTLMEALGKKEGKTVTVKDNEEIERLHEELKKLEEEKDNIAKQSQEEIKRNKLNFLATNKVLNQKLVDQIPGGREFLAKAITEQLNSKYHLNVNDANEIEVKSKDDPSQDVYINNVKVNFDDLIKTELDSQGFIKKNDGGGEPPARKPKFEDDKKPKTYHEMVRANAKPTSIN